MKKSLFMIPLAALVLASCSDKDVADNNKVVNDGESNYISVRIVSGAALTRDGEEADKEYEEGTGAESAVDPETVTFFFFDAEGNVAPVKANGDYWYTPAEEQISIGEGDGNNTESLINAILVINSTEGDLLPQGIVAILNPSDNIKDIVSGQKKISNVDDLLANALAQDYSIKSNNVFVMTNSIYKDETGKHIKMTPVLPEHYQKTAEDAKNNDNAVNIFVERVVGKVTVDNKLEVKATVDGEALYDTGVTYNDGGQQPIYVKLYNWNVTAVTDKSFLVKNIDAENWADNLFGDATLNPWNKPGDFRSFWAINPEGVVNVYDTYSAANAFDYDKNNYTYLQENAWAYNEAYDPEYPDAATFIPSEVILTAQLVNAEGNALGLADVGGMKYVIECTPAAEGKNYGSCSEEGKETIKKALLAYLNTPIYDVTGNASAQPDVTTEVPGISFKDVEVVNGPDMIAAGYDAMEYKVYLQLNKEGLNKKWNTSKTATTGMTTEEINRLLYQLGGAKVWTEGRTYYYIPITHLGKENGTGYYGVVRNHVYKLSLNTLTGLGTPVFDPSNDNIVIHPTHPDKDETYIGAKINVLSWKVVPQGVDLKW